MINMINNSKVKKYLKNDEIFNKINKRFISLEDKDVRATNVHLNKVLEKLIPTMKKQNLLFEKTFNKTVWTGSFYKKTKVGLPDEFDLNLIIKLPINEENIQFSTDLPGYIKIRTNIYKNNTLKMDPKAYRDMMSFIDNGTYLNQCKFRGWLERILSKAAKENNKLKLHNYIITIRKAGPAFTLSLKIPNQERPISIDLVPVLAFSSRRHPPPCSANYISQHCDRDWFLVPKPLNDKFIFDPERHWRLSFYEFEKDILSNYGKAKPIIRHLKKFRDTQNWKCIASYYIETLCFHNLHIFELERESSTSLFFTMLNKLYDAFCNHSIKYYWDENVNLLEKISSIEIKNMKCRLSHIIKNIEKQIIEKPDDSYAIATYVLHPCEIKRLKCDQPESELQVELEPEVENQWRCIIM